MIPASLTDLVKLALRVHQACQDASYNKDQCRRLAGRVAMVDTLMAPLKGRALTPELEGVLQQLHLTLKECLHKLLEFADKSALMRWGTSASIKDDFKDMNARLSESFQDLTSAMIVLKYCSKQPFSLAKLFSLQDDMADRERDLAFLKEIMQRGIDSVKGKATKFFDGADGQKHDSQKVQGGKRGR